MSRFSSAASGGISDVSALIKHALKHALTSTAHLGSLQVCAHARDEWLGRHSATDECGQRCIVRGAHTQTNIGNSQIQLPPSHIPQRATRRVFQQRSEVAIESITVLPPGAGLHSTATNSS